MAQKEYTIFMEDMTKSVVKAENILAALASITPIEKVIRVSLYEKNKVVVSNQVVDEDFEEHEFRPAANT